MLHQYTVIRGGKIIEPGMVDAVATDILIKGSTIHTLGSPGFTVPESSRVINAKGMLMHAGLINGHTHGHGNLAKAMGDRWTLELLLTAGPWISGSRTDEDKYLTTLIGASEMLLKGCTACYDLTYEIPVPSVSGLEAVRAAYNKAGMKALVAPMVADMSFFEAIPGLLDALPAALRSQVEKARLAPVAQTLSVLREIARQWTDRDDAKVRLALAPTIPHHCTDEFLTGCRDIAKDYGLGLHSHVSESKIQAIAGMRKYGTTLTTHLDKLGLIGPDFTVAHGVWLDDRDMKILADKGASIIHNPASNMRLGSGILNIRQVLDYGVNLGIGTDGATSSDNQNMYEAMRLSSFLSKVRGPDWQNWITTKEVMNAATVGSARAIGLGNDIGRIAPGFKADIVFLDTNSINLIPVNNVTNSLVHSEDGRSVSAVMVDGEMVVEHGRLIHVDMDELRYQAENAVLRLQKANSEMRELFYRLEPIVGSFCPGLAAEPFHVHRYGSCQCQGHYH